MSKQQLRQATVSTTFESTSHTLIDSWEKCPRPANMASDPVKLEEALENRKIGIKFDFINHQVKK